MTVRVAARVLLLDPADRLLLFRGVDPGETLLDAARRELYEETGVTLAPDRLTGPVWRRHATFSFDGVAYRAQEWFFLARLDETPDVDSAGFNDEEVATISEHRCWSSADLAATGETVFPAALGALLDDLLAGWDGRVRPIT